MTNKDSKYWIDRLELEPHPEGGYFRQTYRSGAIIARDALPEGFSGERPVATAIYFLLEGENFSAFHRLRSDELWHFYTGSPITIEILHPDGKHSSILLGSDPDVGQLFQAAIPAECWFASHVADWKSFAVVGCTVAPGFDFADFKIAKRNELMAAYPQHRELVERLTRG